MASGSGPGETGGPSAASARGNTRGMASGRDRRRSPLHLMSAWRRAPQRRARSRWSLAARRASTAAKRTWPNASAYHASKWGLLGFSHALQAEARTYGVRVTAVICGGMRTPFILERFPEVDPETLQDPRAVARTIRGLVTAEDD